MATYLLDSSVIIDTINAKRGRPEFLKGLIQQGHLLACCPINVTEVYGGMRPHEQECTTELLESLEFYPISFPAARLAGELQARHRKKGVTLATTDVTIAAVAIHNQLTLLTDNVRHYPMKELSVYSLPA
jgi:predicted nucleic acid-binding protein